MGASSSRRTLFFFSPGRGELRSLVVDEKTKEHTWEAEVEGKATIVTPVTVTSASGWEAPTYVVLHNQSELWPKPIPNFFLDRIELTTAPSVIPSKGVIYPYRTDKHKTYVGTVSEECDPRNVLSEYLWFKAKSSQYRIGFTKSAITKMDVETREISHTPFKYRI